MPICLQSTHTVVSVGGTMVSINIITPVSAPAPSIVGNLNQAGDINHVLSPVSQPSQSPWEHDAPDLSTPPPTFFYKITACIQGRQRQSLFFHGGVTQAFNFNSYIALFYLVLPLISLILPLVAPVGFSS